jgi:hypothetical protein
MIYFKKFCKCHNVPPVQQLKKKVLNIVSNQGNANQNYFEIPFHPSKNGYHLKKKKTNRGFQDGSYREEAESMPPIVKSSRDTGDTPCR